MNPLPSDSHFFKRFVRGYILPCLFFPITVATASPAQHLVYPEIMEMPQEIDQTLLVDHDSEKILNKLADSNAPAMKTLMGAWYAIGAGGKRDWIKARIWFEKAATEGDTRAAYPLGLLYSAGLGTPIDYDKAFHWLSLAARQNIADAQYRLAGLYAQGKGTGKSEREFVHWIKKAAENGHIDAQRTLAMAHLYGIGIPKNLPESVKWFEKAASAGNATAQYYLGMDYMNGNGLAKNEREGEKWLYRAAMQDHLEAQTYLGTIYLKRKLQNEGQPPETALAIQWMENAATRNDPYAIRLLSMVYRHIPELQNNAKGMLHLRRSARWGMHQPNSISEEPCFRIKTHLQNARKLSSGLKKPRNRTNVGHRLFLVTCITTASSFLSIMSRRSLF